MTKRTPFSTVSSIHTSPEGARAVHSALMRLYIDSSNELWAEQASLLRDRMHPPSWRSRVALVSTSRRCR